MEKAAGTHNGAAGTQCGAAETHTRSAGTQLGAAATVFRLTFTTNPTTSSRVSERSSSKNADGTRVTNNKNIGSAWRPRCSSCTEQFKRFRIDAYMLDRETYSESLSVVIATTPSWLLDNKVEKDGFLGHVPSTTWNPSDHRQRMQGKSVSYKVSTRHKLSIEQSQLISKISSTLLTNLELHQVESIGGER